MSDDEFYVADDLANLEGVDWDTVLSVPTNSINTQNLPNHEFQVERENRSLSATSSDYSFDEIDKDTFTELDTLERNATQGQACPSSFTGALQLKLIITPALNQQYSAHSDTHSVSRTIPSSCM
ncbi:hypothetical protein L208DRAFT_390931 [Tricholoma matsutake]|nr:hypothetical protein L208DRAFT_390931 [Tricholoma matsutake 945]